VVPGVVASELPPGSVVPGWYQSHRTCSVVPGVVVPSGVIVPGSVVPGGTHQESSCSGWSQGWYHQESSCRFRGPRGGASGAVAWFQVPVVPSGVVVPGSVVPGWWHQEPSFWFRWSQGGTIRSRRACLATRARELSGKRHIKFLDLPLKARFPASGLLVVSRALCRQQGFLRAWGRGASCVRRQQVSAAVREEFLRRQQGLLCRQERWFHLRRRQ